MANKIIQLKDNTDNLYPNAAGYVAGDTVRISQNTLQFAGVAQNNRTVRFTIPLTKQIYASNVSISGELGIRCKGAWSNTFNVNTATQTCAVSPCGVAVVLSFSSDQSYLVTHYPAIVQPSNLQLIFS